MKILQGKLLSRNRGWHLAAVIIVTLTCIHLGYFQILESKTLFSGLQGGNKALKLTIVIASTLSEDSRWVSENFPDINHAIYIVDDQNTDRQFRTPVNKGNEAMVYLSYIIDHYDRLPEVSVFLHAHADSKHNDDLLGGSAIETIQRLRPAKVVQDGYFNLRCNWKPGGCPHYLNLQRTDNSTDGGQAQAEILRTAWTELFPELIDLPMWAAQAYGGQFAASRQAIRSVQLDAWRRWRDWLVRTDLSDYHSGRVWEYTWQFVLTGASQFCPNMHTCYCEGYGVCFESEHDLQAWRAREQDLEDSISEYLRISPTGGKAIEWKERILRAKEALQQELNRVKQRGDHLYRREKLP